MSEPRRAVLEAIRQKVSQLPTTPGVYLFKDAGGVVLYVGKAKTLRSRVSSYFQPASGLAASRGPDIDRMIRDLVVDVDFLECESEVDALLHESRLIKDIQPRFNARQKDDKTFPYFQVTTDEDFPRVSVTRDPKPKGARLFGPFVSVNELRAAVPLMQRVFKFRTCKLDLEDADPDRRYFRPCILASIKQCTAPCAARVSKADYAQQIADLVQFLNSKASVVRKRLTAEMKQAAEELHFERAAALRDELQALESLQRRGLASQHPQPEVFYVDPAEGLERLGEVLSLSSPVRTIEGVDIAHLSGQELCGAVVSFIDGKPFKPSYRRYKIKTVDGNDDFACIREVVWRRYKYAGMSAELFPDVILIDGGKGQLSAALSAFDELAFRPSTLVALAKKEEELFVQGVAGPIRLSRRDPALRLLQSVRDEAHRFAQHYYHLLQQRATMGRKTAPPNDQPGDEG